MLCCRSIKTGILSGLLAQIILMCVILSNFPFLEATASLEVRVKLIHSVTFLLLSISTLTYPFLETVCLTLNTFLTLNLTLSFKTFSSFPIAFSTLSKHFLELSHSFLNPSNLNIYCLTVIKFHACQIYRQRQVYNKPKFK